MPKKLLQWYAEKLKRIVMLHGCLIDQPSQRQHDCLIMEHGECKMLYFDDAFENVFEEIVIDFMKNFENVKPPVRE